MISSHGSQIVPKKYLALIRFSFLGYNKSSPSRNLIPSNLLRTPIQPSHPRLNNLENRILRVQKQPSHGSQVKLDTPEPFGVG